ncbi:hypothetical protein [Nocardia acidivorans]|uniref:hypothetical protein n=1 Tax=Nocardia acidivorans TaxID=404580 RepID=UPI000833DE16|nr:hypothetical protein [Nocardia acidivorans]
MSSISRRLGAGVAGIATAAAVVVLAAPQASATVDSITITGGDPHTINTEYTLTANLSGAGIGLLVYWTDNGNDLSGPKVPWPVGYSSITWKPTTAGRHLLTCSQGGSTKTIAITVVDPAIPGTPGGGTPGTPGGGSGGSGSSGSAGKALGGLLGGLSGSAGS